MGIEPTRAAPPELENKHFGAITNAKCDGRVKFRGMWGHVRLRRDTWVCEVPGSNLSIVGLSRDIAPKNSCSRDARFVWLLQSRMLG